ALAVRVHARVASSLRALSASVNKTVYRHCFNLLLFNLPVAPLSETELSYWWRNRALLEPSTTCRAVARRRRIISQPSTFVVQGRLHVEILSLKESAEERRRFIRDACNLVRCLTIE